MPGDLERRLNWTVPGRQGEASVEEGVLKNALQIETNSKASGMNP
jgi:hypothetical protein